MKRNMKKWLAVLLALSMTMAPVMSLCAEDAQVKETEISAADDSAGETVLETGQELDVDEVENSDEKIPGVTDGTDAGNESQQTMSDVLQPDDAAMETEDADVKDQSQQTGVEETTADNTEAENSISEVSAGGTDLMTSGGNMTIYADGTYPVVITSTLGMLKAAENPAPQAVVSGNKVTVTFATTKSTYDKLYFGEYGSQSEEASVKGTINSGNTYDFSIQLSQSNLGTAFSFVPGKPDGSWGSKAYEITFSIVGEIPSTGGDSSSDPSEGGSAGETPSEGGSSGDVPSGSDPAEDSPSETDAGLKVEYADGEKAGEEFPMFRITASTAVIRGDQIHITIATEKNTYDRIYLGSKEDAALTDPKGTMVTGALNASGQGYIFTFDVPAAERGQKVSVVPIKASDGKWYDKELVLSIPEEIETEIPESGNYQVMVESSASMFRVMDCILQSRFGKMTAVITLSGTGYDYLYLGSKEEAGQAAKSDWIPYAENAEGKYTYEVPVSALDTEIAVAAHSIRNNAWYDRTLIFHSENMKECQNGGLGNGTYEVTVDSSASMFRVTDCVLTADGGQMSAVITLSGTGYSYLYLGTADKAAKANEDSWIPYRENEKGEYTYEIVVEALDKGIVIAAYSKRNAVWYDRILIFNSEGIRKISGEDSEDSGGDGKTGTGTTGNTGSKGTTGGAGNSSGSAVIDKTPDAESKYESDLSGSTGKVNNATALKDGVYTPDSFSWSGGTGRVSISCNKITVINGQAYATIVFSSSAYSYVKANGNKYYASHSGDTSSFTIPVELNKNNQIIGLTTKMSAAHEITYQIFIYLKAAAEAKGETVSGTVLGSSETLDEEAPDIPGLEYEEEVTLEHAKYFKIYQYEQGVTLLEIDMVTDTAREDLDTEDLREDSVDSQVEDMEAESSFAGESSAELYKGNIVKYLIVPEDVEIPAGLEKDVIVVQKPADKVYAASDDILAQMERIGALDAVAVVACEKEECPVDSIAEKMENEEVIYAGIYDDPDYRALVSSKCNLAILPLELLPRETDVEEENQNTAGVGNADDADIDGSDVEETDAQEMLTVEEQEEHLQEMVEKYALLGIPMIVDRALDEEEGLAQVEWVKVYGVLFGCEEKAEELFAEAVAAEQ